MKKSSLTSASTWRRLLLWTAFMIALATPVASPARSLFSWRGGPKGQRHQVVKPEADRNAAKPEARRDERRDEHRGNPRPERQLDYRWTPGNLHSHWQKHGAEFPEFKSEEEYGRFAVEFYRNPPRHVLKKFRGDGERLQYDEKRNIFTAATKDGIIKTMFRPDRGIRYWERQ